MVVRGTEVARTAPFRSKMPPRLAGTDTVLVTSSTLMAE